MITAYQGKAAESTVRLALSGVPVTGIVFSQATVKYKKYGQVALTTKTLVSGDWLELGNGYYTVKWSAAEMDTVGNFFFQVTGGAFDIFADSFSVEFVPADVAAVPPDICLVSGYIYDIAGTPVKNTQVRVRPVSFPMGDSNGNLVSSLPASAVTDHRGYFQIELLQGKTVMIEVTATGVRNQQIVVPYAPTAQLSDLMPPPPN